MGCLGNCRLTSHVCLYPIHNESITSEVKSNLLDTSDLAVSLEHAVAVKCSAPSYFTAFRQ